MVSKKFVISEKKFVVSENSEKNSVKNKEIVKHLNFEQVKNFF